MRRGTAHRLALVWLGFLALVLPGCGRRQAGAAPEVRIQVTRDGFVPAVATAPAGPVTLVVTRRTDETCATDMVFMGLDTTVSLPLRRPVRIPITLAAGETLHYACGMDMYKGQVVAR